MLAQNIFSPKILFPLLKQRKECSYYWALSAIPAGNYISSRINLSREVRLAIVPVNDQMYYAID